MSFLHIECTSAQKAAWVKAAQKSPAGPALADWVKFALNHTAANPPKVEMIELVILARTSDSRPMEFLMDIKVDGFKWTPHRSLAAEMVLRAEDRDRMVDKATRADESGEFAYSFMVVDSKPETKPSKSRQ